MKTTLPTDSQARKQIPLLSGVFRYFPAALAGVARISKAGNDKHNPGEPLHHARGKSMDHGDCLLRHLMDLQDHLALLERRTDAGWPLSADDVLTEADSVCWRALAMSQELHERYGGAPLAPGAKLPADCQKWDEMRARDGERVISPLSSSAASSAELRSRHPVQG